MRVIVRSVVVSLMVLSLLIVARIAEAKEAGLITGVTGNVYYGKDKK